MDRIVPTTCFLPDFMLMMLRSIQANASFYGCLTMGWDSDAKVFTHVLF